MSRRDRVWPIAIVGLSLSSLALILADLDTPVRAPVVLAFAVVCPGMALVRLVRLEEPWMEFVLAIVVSLCLIGVIATGAIYAAVWDVKLVCLAVVAVTLVGVLADLLRAPEYGSRRT